MTDFELIKKKDYYNLWNKYKALMTIYYKRLPDDVRNYLFVDLKDFQSSCYEIVVNAAIAIKLDKIKNPKTFTFWQQLSFYLQNYTTRQCVRDTWQIWGKEMSYQWFDDNYSSEVNMDLAVEDHFEYKMLMNDLTDEERDIVNQRLVGATWAEIYKKYGYKNGKALRFSLEKKILDYIGD